MKKLHAVLGTLALSTSLALPAVAQTTDPTSAPATETSGAAPEPIGGPTAAPAASPAPVQAARPRPGPWFFHFNVALMAYASPGRVGGPSLGPGNSLTFFQQVGIGYWVHRNVRPTFTLQFGERFTTVNNAPQCPATPPANAPPCTGELALAAAIPWVVFTFPPFFAGVGAIIGGVTRSALAFDMGVFGAVGLALPVGGGWSLGAAVQSALWLVRDPVQIAVAPAVMITRRW